MINDFAYGDVCFDDYRAPSFLSVPGAKEVGVETTTMSKGYNMAGWRIGFCAGNPEMVRALATIKGWLYDYGLFQAVQIAAIMARLRIRRRSGRGSNAVHLSAECAMFSSMVSSDLAGLLPGLRQTMFVVAGPNILASGRARQAQFDRLFHEASGRGGSSG